MIKVVGDKLRQWDLDRRVEIAPNHNREIMAVRFFKAHVNEPIEVAIVEEDGVVYAPIPNTFLRDFGVLNIEMKVRDEQGRRYHEEYSFYIHKEKKPEGYVYVETPAKTGGGAKSWNDLTDKPFYTEPVPPYEVFPETTLESIGADGGVNVFGYMGAIPVVPGETYTVVWNGKEYPCTCNAVNDEAISLGNLAIMGAGDDTGEPFVMAILAVGAEIYGNDGATSVTLAIMGDGGEKVHTLDPKYIKDMYHSESGKVYTLENIDLSNIVQEEMVGVIMLTEPLRITSGETYYLEYAGKVYTTVADGGKVAFEGIYTPDYPTESPIVFVFESTYDFFAIVNAYERERNWEGLTINLYREGEIISRIPTKYTPIPVLFNFDNDDNVSCSHSFDEIMALVANGFLNFILYKDNGVGGGDCYWPLHLVRDSAGLLVGFGDMYRNIYTIRYAEDGTLSCRYDWAQ